MADGTLRSQRGLGSQFLNLLSLKAADADRRVTGVDPRCTSHRCSKCGHTEKADRRSQAVFVCVSCDHEANADYNAAKNVLDRGTSAERGEPLDRGTSTERGEPLDRGTSTERGEPLDRGTSTERGEPLGRACPFRRQRSAQRKRCLSSLRLETWGLSLSGTVEPPTQAGGGLRPIALGGVPAHLPVCLALRRCLELWREGGR
ncbi:transposase [Deinococcus sp. DB0503]|uniref:transposase n=1 Tax=Deinococcus sp. DB0503 TaxID=2479203 RepID=UPI001E44C206|nr:transposase [Deinococcus sp. DB0503]